MPDSEVAAVEAALNAIVLADSEASFQKVVSRMLPAILQALATESPAARAKCIEALKHINIRLQAFPNIILPFDTVLQTIVNPQASPFTRNIAIHGGYLAKCYQRLPQKDRAATLVPLIKATLSSLTEGSKKYLFNYAFQALQETSALHPSSASNSVWSIVEQCPEEGINNFFEYSLLALRQKLENPVPEQILLGIVRLASEYAGVKQPERAVRVFPHFLVAAGTANRSALSAAGEDALKRIETCEHLAKYDPTISDKLFDLFLNPLSEVPLRIVVLSKGLLKVTLCASCFPEVVEVMTLSLLTPGIPPRLQALGMQFVSFVVSHSDIDILSSNSKQIVDIMMKLILNQTNNGPSFSEKMCGFGYTGLAEIITKVPDVMNMPDVSTDLFFSAAQSNNVSGEVRTCAAQGISTLSRTLRFSNDKHDATRSSVLNTLRKTIQNREDHAGPARLSAVKWADECFAPSDAEARMISIIASSDPRLDVCHAANLSLFPKRTRKLDESRMMDGEIYPNLNEVIQIVQNETDIENRTKSMTAYFLFSISILRNNIVKNAPFETLNREDLAKYFADNLSIATAVEKLVQNANQSLLNRIGVRDADLTRASLSVVVLASKVETLSEKMAQTYHTKLDTFVDLVSKKLTESDIAAAHALSYLVGSASTSLNSSAIEKKLRSIGESLAPDESGTASGREGEDDRASRLLCLGEILSRCRYRDDIPWSDKDDTFLSQICLNMVRRTMLSTDSSTIVRISACDALGLIGTDGPLPVPIKYRSTLIGTLIGIIKSHDSDRKLVQAAATALGKICVGEPRTSFVIKSSEALLVASKERKEDEVRFIVAESLVRCASGFDAPPPFGLTEGTEEQKTFAPITDDSDQLLSILRIRDTSHVVQDPLIDEGETPPTKSILHRVIVETLKLAYDERPNARAGGCVCLFTFLRLLGQDTKEGEEKKFLKFRSSEDAARLRTRRNVLQDLLLQFQGAFVTLLGDKSDFVQQLASCGTALLYDLCAPDAQHNLVTTLVRSLTTGKKAASTVPGDTGSLMEFEGSDAKENTVGKNSATYKELCTIAQDMGQPELVYKLMDLAGHTALWNTRKGAALAGGALLKTDVAAQQLRPHLSKLLPRLYVYCYDPTENVRIAMSSVTTSIVKAAGLGSVSEAINTNYNEIINYCLSSIVSRQWRSREAACGALRDALISKTWQQVKNRMSDFWYYTLRALDDIKESVRKAAGGTGRALSELSVNVCNPDQVSIEVATEAISVVLPAILPAFTHAVAEVRMLATTTLSDIIRRGGNALRTSVPQLMGSLLEAATELEPQVLNYAQYHIDSPEELQKMRVTAAATSESPLIDALERLAALIDESIIEDVVRTLTRLSRVGVGIPTRTATARCFDTVLRTRAVVAASFSHKLLSAAVTAAAMDRDPDMRAMWCTAAGTAAMLAPQPAVGKFVDEIVKLSGSEEAGERSLASSLAVGLWKRSPDTARKYASAMLPIAYMGRQETDDNARGAGSNWEEVWNEGAPSTEAGLRLYAPEITEICQHRLLTSSQYRVKRSAAATLGALASASNDSVDVIHLAKAAKALIETIPGHVWDGKIVAVEGVGKIASSCSNTQVWESSGGIHSAVKLMLQESNRGRTEYRLAAMNSATELLRRCESAEGLFKSVWDSLAHYWKNEPDTIPSDEAVPNVTQTIWETGSDASAVDARNKARKSQKQLCVAALTTLEASFSSADESQFVEHRLLEFLSAVQLTINGDWEVRLGALHALAKICERIPDDLLHKSNPQGDAYVITQIFEYAVKGIQDAKYSSLRKAGVSVFLSLAQHTDSKDRIRMHIDKELMSILQSKKGDSDPSVQTEAKKLGKLLNI